MGGNATLPMTISVKLIAYAMPNARTEHILLKLIVSVTPAITVVKLVLMELAVKLAKPIDKFLQERLFALVLTIFMKIIMFAKHAITHARLAQMISMLVASLVKQT